MIRSSLHSLSWKVTFPAPIERDQPVRSMRSQHNPSVTWRLVAVRLVLPKPYLRRLARRDRKWTREYIRAGNWYYFVLLNPTNPVPYVDIATIFIPHTWTIGGFERRLCSVWEPRGMIDCNSCLHEFSKLITYISSCRCKIRFVGQIRTKWRFHYRLHAA